MIIKLLFSIAFYYINCISINILSLFSDFIFNIALINPKNLYLFVLNFVFENGYIKHVLKKKRISFEKFKRKDFEKP